MPLLLTLLVFIPLALAVVGASGKRFSEALPFVFLGLSLLLYVLGLFSCLVAAAWMIWFLWGCSVVFLGIVVFGRLRRREKLPIPTAGLVLFVVLATVLWWLCRGSRYAIWDEFSHWGRAVKAVFSQNVFPALAQGEDNFRDYPPGVAPLQALVLKMGGMDFREDVVIFTQGLFSLSLLLYPLRRFEWKNAPGAAFGALLLMLAPAGVFWNYYTGTMVDGLLGVLFAFVLVVHFFGDGGTFELVLQCMACAMLPLLKSAGLLWAILAVLIVLLDKWMKLRREKKSRLVLQEPGPKWKGRQALAWAAPILSGLAATLSWSLFIALNNVPRRWSAGGFSFSALGQLFLGEPEWRVQTAQSYAANVFLEQNYGWPIAFLPFMGFFVLFAGCWFLLRLATPKEQMPHMKIAFWGLFCSGLLYTLLLLANYLFLFSEYEAVRLSSLSRYLNTYLAAMLVFLAAWVAQLMARQKPLRQLCSFGAAAVFWAGVSNPPDVLGPFVTAPANAVSTAANQQAYTEAAQRIRQRVHTPQARVYVVAMDDLGSTTLRLGYELFPQWLPEHTSSIGPDYAEDDLLSLRISRQGWAEMLRDGYDYVYLFSVNEIFLDEFGPLFEEGAPVEDGGLYKVAPQGDSIALEWLE